MTSSVDGLYPTNQYWTSLPSPPEATGRKPGFASQFAVKDSQGLFIPQMEAALPPQDQVRVVLGAQ